ncbi:MAG: very short patch repair endonuclease [Anaerocolumna sp.]|jgi:DNA mismatch endonuclease (patch repair protein)|nr:very short patch repair endonuclease [Anaerocolumna sp.]
MTEPRFKGTASPKSHYNMSKIRSKDTSIELILRKALWKKGIHYRKNYKEIPGSPDIAITKYKIAIFCDSEFFHGKDWEVLKPKLEKGSNGDYWVKKIERNIQRDDEKDKQLLFEGWIVIRFWGKDITHNLDECIRVIEETIFDVLMGMDLLYY